MRYLFDNTLLMSQAGTAGGGGGPVGPAIETITGNTGGAVGPTLNNVNVVADSTSFNGVGNAGPTGYLINGTPGSSLLALQPNAYTLSIPPSTTGILFTITVTATTSITISAEAACISDNAANKAAGGFFIGTAYNVGAGAVILNTVDQGFNDAIGANVLSWQLQPSGNDAQLVIVNGSVTDTWNVTAYIRYTIHP